MTFYFIPNRLFWLVCLVVSLALLFLIVLPVMAQDQTPVPTAGDVVVVDEPSSPVIPPDVLPATDAGAAVLALVLNFLAPFAASPLTTTLVSVLKLFLPTSISAPTIRNVVAAVLTVLYWLAVHYNFQDTFQSVGQFLVTVLPAAFLLYKNFVDSSRIHDEAVKAQTPLLSFKRT